VCNDCCTAISAACHSERSEESDYLSGFKDSSFHFVSFRMTRIWTFSVASMETRLYKILQPQPEFLPYVSKVLEIG